MTPPSAVHARDRVGEEAVGRGALPLRVGGGEVLADVAVADRAEDGVGQRVQDHVGVGVADQPARVRDRDAAEHDVRAGAQRVDVVADADAHVAEAQHLVGQHAPVGGGDVGGGRQLDVARVAGHGVNRDARPIRRPPRRR